MARTCHAIGLKALHAAHDYLDVHKAISITPVEDSMAVALRTRPAWFSTFNGYTWEHQAPLLVHLKIPQGYIEDLHIVLCLRQENRTLNYWNFVALDHGNVWGGKHRFTLLVGIYVLKTAKLSESQNVIPEARKPLWYLKSSSCCQFSLERWQCMCSHLALRIRKTLLRISWGTSRGTSHTSCYK